MMKDNLTKLVYVLKVTDNFDNDTNINDIFKLGLKNVDETRKVYWFAYKQDENEKIFAYSLNPRFPFESHLKDLQARGWFLKQDLN